MTVIIAKIRRQKGRDVLPLLFSLLPPIYTMKEKKRKGKKGYSLPSL